MILGDVILILWISVHPPISKCQLCCHICSCNLRTPMHTHICEPHTSQLHFQPWQVMALEIDTLYRVWVIHTVPGDHLMYVPSGVKWVFGANVISSRVVYGMHCLSSVCERSCWQSHHYQLYQVHYANIVLIISSLPLSEVLIITSSCNL